MKNVNFEHECVWLIALNDGWRVATLYLPPMFRQLCLFIKVQLLGNPVMFQYLGFLKKHFVRCSGIAEP